MKFKDFLAITIVFFIFFTLSLSVTFFLKSKSEKYSLGGSSYSNTAWGTKALYLYLQQQGYDVQRWQLPLPYLTCDSTQPKMMVVINTPQRGNYACQDRSGSGKGPDFVELYEWVRKGNTLFIVGNSSYIFQHDLMTCAVDQKEENPFFEEEFDVVEVNSVLPTYYSRGVGSIMVREDSSFTIKRKDALVHFKDEHGAILASLKEGKGKVVLLSDLFLASNKGITQADNSVLLSNIFFVEGYGKTIYFNEFDHGYSSEKGIIDYFQGSALKWIILHFILVAGTYFYSFGKYFGRPIAVNGESPRTTNDYIEALSSIYHKAQAFPVAVADVYTRYKAQWIRMFMVANEISPAQFSQLIAARIKRDVGDIQPIISRCESVAGGGRISKHEALEIIEKLERIRKELNDGRCGAAVM